MRKSKNIFVKFNPGNSIDLKYSIQYKESQMGMYSAYIPGFDIYYSTNNKSNLKGRSQKLLKVFIDFWLENNSRKCLTHQLNKLGFKSNNQNNSFIFLNNEDFSLLNKNGEEISELSSIRLHL